MTSVEFSFTFHPFGQGWVILIWQFVWDREIKPGTFIRAISTEGITSWNCKVQMMKCMSRKKYNFATLIFLIILRGRTYYFIKTFFGEHSSSKKPGNNQNALCQYTKIHFDEHVPEIQGLLTPNFCSCLPPYSRYFKCKNTFKKGIWGELLVTKYRCLPLRCLHSAPMIARGRAEALKKPNHLIFMQTSETSQVNSNQKCLGLYW